MAPFWLLAQLLEEILELSTEIIFGQLDKSTILIVL
jgi:hypothetical protein